MTHQEKEAQEFIKEYRWLILLILGGIILFIIIYLLIGKDNPLFP